MSARLLPAWMRWNRLRMAVITTVGLAAGASDADAAWNVAAGVEHLAWTEDTSPITVRERGIVSAIEIGLSSALAGPLVGEYRGRFYLGHVAYDGSRLYEPTVPAEGSTRYYGTTQRGAVRHPMAGSFEAALGLDLDLWRRQLGPSQAEDYRIVSMRFGVARPFSASIPWRMAAGVKLTLSTHENANLTALGFAENPTLRPGRSVTPYAELAHAFAERWSIAGTFEGFDFGASNTVVLHQGASTITFDQPASTLRIIGLRLEYRAR